MISIRKLSACLLVLWLAVGQSMADSFSSSSRSWTNDEGQVCSEVCDTTNGCRTVCLDQGTAIAIAVAIIVGTLIFVIGGCVLLCFCCRWCCFSNYKRETRGVVHRA